MEPVQAISLAVFAAMAICLILSAYFDRGRVRTASDFLLHSEELKLGQLTSTLVATNLSLGNMIFVCAIFGFYYGFTGAFWMAATIISLTAGFLVFGRRFRTYIEDKGANFGTVHDFIARAHAPGHPASERRIRMRSGIISSTSLFLALVIEVHLAATFASPILGVSRPWVVAVLIMAVAAYSISGGFRSVVFTDVIQSLFLGLGLVAGVAFFYSLPNGFSALEATPPLTEVLTGLGPYTPLGLLVLGFAWLLATPDTWQRNCASRRLDTSLAGAAIGGVIMTACVVMFALAGYLVKVEVEPIVAAHPLYSSGRYPLSDIFLLPVQGLWTAVLLAVMAGALLMAAISTMDTFIVVIAHVLSVDMSPKMNAHRGIPDRATDSPACEELVFRARTIIFLGSLAVLLGWFVLDALGALGEPVNLFFVTYSIQIALFVPVVMATRPGPRVLGAAEKSLFFAALVTLGAGLPAMVFYETESVAFLLRPADWLSLLPIITIAAGALAYGLGAVTAKSEEPSR